MNAVSRSDTRMTEKLPGGAGKSSLARAVQATTEFADRPASRNFGDISAPELVELKKLIYKWFLW